MGKQTGVAVTKTQFLESMGNIDITDFSQIGEMLKLAKNVDYKELQQVSGGYFEFKDQCTYVLFCSGMTDIEPLEDTRQEKLNERGMCDAVELVDEHGNSYVNADVVMISTVKRLAAKNMVPCLLHVFCNGTKGETKKKYKNLEIRKF